MSIARDDVFELEEMPDLAEHLMGRSYDDECLKEKCAKLEIENAKLRWYLKDIRRLVDRVPDHSLPRSVRFKRWSQQTLIEMATRTAPRIAVIWGGAAAIAYIVHLIVR